MRTSSLDLLLFASLCGLSVACSESVTDVDDAIELPLVAVEPVVALDFTERILATGELRAENHAQIAAEVDGRVTKLWVEEGTAVEQGIAILELDPVRRQLELDAATARVSETSATLTEARREVRRRSELRKSDISSISVLEKAQTQARLAESRHHAAQANLGVAQRSLAEATVRAPFSGMLVERKVSLGEYVQQGTALVELVSLNPIEVVFSVAEIDSGRVHTGQRVKVTVAPYPGEEFDAVVDVVSPTIDRETRTLRVKARLDNSDGRLRPGLFARADLGVAQRTGVPVISDMAVLQRTDGSVVFTLDPTTNRVSRKVIELGGFREGKIEIASGLSPGELVLTKGHPSLSDGALVRRLAPSVPPPAVAVQEEGEQEVNAEVSIQ